MKNFVLVLFITFLVSFSANAQKAVWAERIAGIYDDYAYSIAVDSQGNTYVAGFSLQTH